jgi:hypothetical protein
LTQKENRRNLGPEGWASHSLNFGNRPGAQLKFWQSA